MGEVGRDQCGVTESRSAGEGPADKREGKGSKDGKPSGKGRGSEAGTVIVLKRIRLKWPYRRTSAVKAASLRGDLIFCYLSLSFPQWSQLVLPSSAC